MQLHCPDGWISWGTRSIYSLLLMFLASVFILTVHTSAEQKLNGSHEGAQTFAENDIGRLPTGFSWFHWFRMNCSKCEVLKD